MGTSETDGVTPIWTHRDWLIRSDSFGISKKKRFFCAKIDRQLKLIDRKFTLIQLELVFKDG